MNRIVLLSGGLDSTAALFWARSRGDCFALSVNYGQAHADRELASAMRATGLAEVSHKLVKLDYPWPAAQGRVVPGRNLALLNLAASHAMWANAPVEVIIGACLADAAGFPDCRPSFLLAAQHVIGLGLGVEVRITAPWIDRTKAQILRASKALGPVAWDAARRSWSCYEGRTMPCGVCSACVLRAEGFAEAAEEDLCVR